MIKIYKFYPDQYTKLIIKLKELTHIIVYMVQRPLVRQGIYFRGFVITLRHTTLGRTPMEE